MEAKLFSDLDASNPDTAQNQVRYPIHTAAPDRHAQLGLAIHIFILELLSIGGFSNTKTLPTTCACPIGMPKPAPSANPMLPVPFSRLPTRARGVRRPSISC
jgi:hypothetical protein